jgi:hypothetical protein
MFFRVKKGVSKKKHNSSSITRTFCAALDSFARDSFALKLEVDLNFALEKAENLARFLQGEVKGNCYLLLPFSTAWSNAGFATLTRNRSLLTLALNHRYVTQLLSTSANS